MGLGAVQAGDVDEGLLVGALAVGTAVEILDGSAAPAGGGQVGMGVIAMGGGLARILQGPRLLVRVHLLAREHRPVEGLQLVGHVVERFQAVHGEVGTHHEQAAARLARRSSVGRVKGESQVRPLSKRLW